MDGLTNINNNINTNNNNNGLPEERGWEYKQITVTRVPGFGFGIAVSGGRDNPHFASGDPSIAVSDVLAAGPAERILQVNDRIISVNGISLQNVDYATAVQVLRDSGDTVVLVVKRRIHQPPPPPPTYVPTPLAALGLTPLPTKITITKSSKKEDFGIVLGCKLFIKEISSKTRDQLLNTNQSLNEGDFLSKLNNTNCNDLMSLKEAKKILDSTKDKLHLTITRDYNHLQTMHQTQSSISTTGAVNNFYKGDDFNNIAYSNQNLYVQPPTRNPNNSLTNNGGFDDKLESGPNSLVDDKSNLAPRGRSRGPLSEANLSQLDVRYGGRSPRKRDEPPRPPPPRAEDYYPTRKQLYEDDPIVQKKQPIPDARFITFHKEGSVGIRLTGGNFVGIFVTAVQPGSPASLQGLQPGDKILKVNDMDMGGVTREEAVLFLLSLQDRIELIVQYCKDEYDGVVASQKGDSFYVKTHFHHDSPAKGEMSFRSGDVFHVIDTLYNGVVGCWQVYRIGRNNQEVQKGIIPNKSRAEELATAQFNATKKEMSANESRGSFFRRRRSSNRRSKSLGKEHWDDILFSDTVSKFPAYERVLLKHPGFTRPVILFGPIADLARDKLLKDFPDKFISPQLDTSSEDQKSQKTSNIIRLSAIKDVIATGKHAILDITPNAVERLNYAQMYPIVIYFKADTKMVIKQLRTGLPKSAHKSSKKLLEQCQKLDKVWNHIFSATITLNDNTDNWYRKVRDIIDKQQSNGLWTSESKPISLSKSHKTRSLPPIYRNITSNRTRTNKSITIYGTRPIYDPRQILYPDSYYHTNASSNLCNIYATLPFITPTNNYQINEPEESLADDFLFPMSSLRLSYASSPESDLEHSPGPPVSAGLGGGVSPTAGRLTKASSDPSVVMPDNNTDVLPPYQPNYDTRYGFNTNRQDLHTPPSPTTPSSKDPPNYSLSNPDLAEDYKGVYGSGEMVVPSMQHKRQPSTLHGGYNVHRAATEPPQVKNDGGYGVPDLPPRVDRAIKPINLVTTPNKTANGRSAHERLFGTKAPPPHHDDPTDYHHSTKLNSLERSHNSKSDSLSSYDSYNKQTNQRIGPNAHDDLKTTLSKTSAQNSPSKYSGGGGGWDQHGSKLDLKYGLPSLEGAQDDVIESPRGSVERDIYRYQRSPAKSTGRETKTDYGKYSRNNAVPDYPPPQQQPSHMNMVKATPIQPPSHNGYDLPPPPPPNNGGYKPVPPPKPKNYKPPYKYEQMPPYQHGKSHSNPVDQRAAPPPHNYYYNMPPQPNNGGMNWQQAQYGGYDMAYDNRRHPSISYASRSEIAPIAQQHDQYAMDGGDMLMDARPPERSAAIVDLQGSREQRGSAFELYRKPMAQHNLRCGGGAYYGSQPNIARLTDSPRVTPKLTKTRSFSRGSAKGGASHEVFDFLRRLTSRRRGGGGGGGGGGANNGDSAINGAGLRVNANARDITSAIVDHRGAILHNRYWGVKLEVPDGAVRRGERKRIYFVVGDPRRCADAPPLDHDNGERMLSPLVMCGPQGTQFHKPVILHIPHYANTLPSLGISLKATDSEQDLHTDWDSILLPGNHAANTVAVKVDHF